MGSARFGQNWLSFEEGLERIHWAIEEVDFQPSHIVTSRDDVAVELRRLLGVDDVLPGIEQWQLPIYMNGPSQFFITVGQPRVKVPTHSHDKGICFASSQTVRLSMRARSSWREIGCSYPQELPIPSRQANGATTIAVVINVAALVLLHELAALSSPGISCYWADLLSQIRRKSFWCARRSTEQGTDHA
jgi:hypothetical protein